MSGEELMYELCRYPRGTIDLTLKTVQHLLKEWVKLRNQRYKDR